ALLACRHAFIRPELGDFTHSFSKKTNKLLRMLALLVPLPFLVAAPSVVYSQYEYEQGNKLATDRDYEAAKRHL
ncbi:hypothetical protein ACSTKI_00045, partial [Vibrio parahaemolyticus]